MTEKFLLNTRDAAQMLDLSPRTLEAWRLRGEGPAHIRLGRRRIAYRRSILESWIEERSRRSTSDRRTLAL